MSFSAKDLPSSKRKWKTWKRKTCDRCGEVKFTRPWYSRHVILCAECIEIAEKESKE